MKKSLLAIALLAAAAHSHAANTAELAWTAPVYESPLTYNVYQGLKGQPLTKVLSGITAVTTIISTGLASGTEVCWYVTAAANGLESAPSNTACKTFPFVPPAAPTLSVK